MRVLGFPPSTRHVTSNRSWSVDSCGIRLSLTVPGSTFLELAQSGAYRRAALLPCAASSSKSAVCEHSELRAVWSVLNGDNAG